MIEFQYFIGCPGYQQTLKNLEDILSESEFRDVQFKITNIENMQMAQENLFQGSPSILVNGKDIITGQAPKSISYACRVYEIGGKMEGSIPKALIRQNLRKFR